MQRLKNESGLSIPIILLLVVIMIAVGLAGWKLYDNSQTKTENAVNTSASKAGTSTKLSTSDGQNAVKLPKMSIQFTKSDSLKSLTFIETSSTADPATTDGYGSESYPIAFFSNSKLDANAACKLSDKGGALGALWKVPGQYPAEATIDNTPGTLVKQFPEYYLAYRVPGMSCTDDPGLNAEITAGQDALKATLTKTAKLIN